MLVWRLTLLLFRWACVYLTVDAQSKELSAAASCGLRRSQMAVVEFYMKDVFWKPVILETFTFLHHFSETAARSDNMMTVISRTASILENNHT